MAEFGFGKVVDVRPVPSQGVTRIVIEIPIEYHVAGTRAFYGQNAVVRAVDDPKQPYGMFRDAAAPEVGADIPAVAQPAEKSPVRPSPGIKPYGEVARSLYLSEQGMLPFLLVPRALARIGTPEELKACLLRGREASHAFVQVGDNAYCGVVTERRDDGDYGAITADPKRHRAAVLKNLSHWFAQAAFGAESMGYVPPEDVVAWVVTHGLAAMLPLAYRKYAQASEAM